MDLQHIFTQIRKIIRNRKEILTQCQAPTIPSHLTIKRAMANEKLSDVTYTIYPENHLLCDSYWKII